MEYIIYKTHYPPSALPAYSALSTENNNSFGSNTLQKLAELMIQDARGETVAVRSFAKGDWTPALVPPSSLDCEELNKIILEIERLKAAREKK